MMKNEFKYLAFIKKLTSFSARQFEGEKKTARFLLNKFRRNKIHCYEQKFVAKVPITKKAVLKADKRKIKCEGTSFIGGKISGKENIINSQKSSLLFEGKENINFNPSCPAISNSNYYFVPSVSISRDSLKDILNAKNIKGEVKVSSKKYITSNILVGNRKNPQCIIFAHYDSIKKGAIDNASGVSVAFGVVVNNKEMLEKCLFVFSGNEELSYDKPVYWGHGYRIFEKKYFGLLEKTKKIIVIDCLGYDKSTIIQDSRLMKLGFPIANIKKLKRKTYLLTAKKLDYLMSVYHSDLDDGRGIKEKYLIDAGNLLTSQIN
jgi:hypothetical protein